jgi:hypothetical protein
VSRAAGAAGAKAAEADKQSRLLEMFTVAILGIATVASAWCAFQSSRWNDVSDDEARTATDLRVEQSRLYSQGTQIGLYDTQIVTAYASALADKNEALQTFLHDSLMRPALVPIVDDWLASIRAGATDVTGLLENPDYLDGLFGPANAVGEEVTAATTRSTDAGSNADGYLRTTLFMASALFFAGVVTSFKARGAKAVLLLSALMLLALGAAQIADLPVT